ncbi:hypothetical protein QBC34DRAFT_131239 [Podospora aff. communis PSN243]|uniref:Uncharacterized protein n=1 Tax=Podospora aff. communis PSN243 TaxID=3040156 RepID=A0AAV9GHW8_9PEZI|nr:hypothetical protein QBC34DRAFT_131239 [Podospora aff. communis PSN243]
MNRLILRRGRNEGCDGGNISDYRMRCASTGHACGLPRLGPALRIIGARTFATRARRGRPHTFSSEQFLSALPLAEPVPRSGSPGNGLRVEAAGEVSKWPSYTSRRNRRAVIPAVRQSDACDLTIQSCEWLRFLCEISSLFTALCAALPRSATRLVPCLREITISPMLTLWGEWRQSANGIAPLRRILFSPTPTPPGRNRLERILTVNSNQTVRTGDSVTLQHPRRR